MAAWYETPSAELRYRWRLDGGRWSDATATAELRVALEAGDYTLQVQSIDRFGNAEDPPATVRIRVERQLRWWIGVLLALAAAALIALRRRGSARRAT